MWQKRMKLGSGSFGKVYFAENHNNFLDPSTTLKAAVKTAPVENSINLKREALFLKKLKGNPYVIEGYGEDISLDEEENGYVFNLLMEYAAGGSLKDLIASYEGNVPEDHVACYAYMLLKGISFVHDKDIVHCDIKPENVLVFPTKNGRLKHVKLSDFGLSKNVTDNVEGARGTETYASPESLEQGIQGKAADIWSFGSTVLEMLIGGKDIWEYDFYRKKPEIPDHVSETGRDFLNKCFRHMKTRWSADKLLNHPFIKDMNKRMVADPGFELHDLLDYQINPFGSSWIDTQGMFYPRTDSVAPQPVIYDQCTGRLFQEEDLCQAIQGGLVL